MNFDPARPLVGAEGDGLIPGSRSLPTEAVVYGVQCTIVLKCLTGGPYAMHMSSPSMLLRLRVKPTSARHEQTREEITEKYCPLKKIEHGRI